MQSDIEKRLLDRDFAYLRPWFYQNPHALRCELGQGDDSETYMHNAYRHAKEIFAILFPDGVTIANGEATSWGALNSVSQWNDATKCTTTQWTALAAKGCVFLPITGYRSGTTVEQATYVGHYWSSTPANNEETKAISLMFSNQLLFLSNIGDFRCNGHAVRLVKDVE
jgi:hypothetical protein